MQLWLALFAPCSPRVPRHSTLAIVKHDHVRASHRSSLSELYCGLTEQFSSDSRLFFFLSLLLPRNSIRTCSDDGGRLEDEKIGSHAMWMWYCLTHSVQYMQYTPGQSEPTAVDCPQSNFFPRVPLQHDWVHTDIPACCANRRKNCRLKVEELYLGTWPVLRWTAME